MAAQNATCLLTYLYENTEEIQLPLEELMMVHNNEEPSSYVEASKKEEWRK